MDEQIVVTVRAGRLEVRGTRMSTFHGMDLLQTAQRSLLHTGFDGILNESEAIRETSAPPSPVSYYETGERVLDLDGTEWVVTGCTGENVGVQRVAREAVDDLPPVTSVRAFRADELRKVGVA